MGFRVITYKAVAPRVRTNKATFQIPVRLGNQLTFSSYSMEIQCRGQRHGNQLNVNKTPVQTLRIESKQELCST